MPRVSIVLPSYNRARYISSAIESCLSQTFKDFELIIVDDCSTDNSCQIIQNYIDKDLRVKLIKNIVNQGLPNTLNVGFSYAIGEYFTWISDDNIFHKDALQEMVKLLDHYSSIGLVYTDYTLIDESDIIGKRIYQEEPEFLPIRDCVGACFLYRSNITQQIGGYDNNFSLVEDYEYWLRMCLVTDLFHIPKSLYYYRVHSLSLTNTKKQAIREAKIRLKKIYYDKYTIPKKYLPINELYLWFINKKTPYSIINLLKIILLNPITTISYIIKNFRRL